MEVKSPTKPSTWINKRVQVYWNKYEQHFTGTVTKHQPSRRSKAKFFVEYDDGDKNWELEEDLELLDQSKSDSSSESQNEDSSTSFSFEQESDEQESDEQNQQKTPNQILIYCPINDCSRSQGKFVGWIRQSDCKTHIKDKHLSKGQSAEDFKVLFNKLKWKKCDGCPKVVSISHKSCTSCKSKLSKITSPLDDFPDTIDVLQPTSSLPKIEEIAKTRVPIIRHVPNCFKNPLAKIFNKALQDILLFNNEHYWTIFLMLPKCILLSPPRKNMNYYSIKAKMQKWVDGDLASLWSEALHHKLETTSSRSAEAKAINLVMNGNLSAACSTLQGEKPLPFSDETYEKLKSKHPHEDTPHFDNLPSGKIEVKEEIVMSLLKKFKRGSGGGPFGLLPEHLLFFCNANIHTSSPALLTKLMDLMINGTVPEEVRPWLFGASLAALDKEGGNIRPIAVGNSLRRLASKYVSLYYKDEIGVVFQPQQFSRVGTESVIHITRSFVNSNLKNNEDIAIIKLDISNAFNSIFRSTVVPALGSISPASTNYLLNCYQKPSYLIYGDRIVESTRGVQQGDPIGMDAFCAGIHPVVKHLNKFNLSLNAWYADDATLAGSYHNLNEALNYINQEFPKIGLQVNLNKSLLIPLKGLPSPDLLFNIPQSQNRNFELLGSPIGDISYTKSFMNEKILQSQPLLDILAGKLDNAHVSFTLLKYCTSYCKMVYLMRTVPSEVLNKTIGLFDQKIISCLEDIIHSPISSDAQQQASLSTNLGGLGLRRTLNHSCAAYTASFCKALPVWKQVLQTSEDPQTLLEAKQMFFKITGSEVKEEFPTQQKLSRIIDEHNFKQLKARLDPAGQARLLSCSADHANDWVNVIPSRAHNLYLERDIFTTAARFLLGLDSSNYVEICPSCQKENLDPQGTHATTCKCNGDTIARHNALRDEFHLLCLSASLTCEKEHKIGYGKKRPGDVFVKNWRNGKGADFDIAVVSSELPSRLEKSSLQRGIVASDYEHYKRNCSEELCNKMGTTFIPLVVETHGCWGPSAIPPLNFLATLIASKKQISVSNAKREMFQRLSTVLQRRNAISILSRSGSNFTHL
jgi:hypothetical protein